MLPSLRTVFAQIPETGIEEVELAQKCSLAIGVLRSRLSHLHRENLIEKLPKKRWRTIPKKIISDQELLDLIPFDGIDEIVLAVHAELGLPDLRFRLAELRSRGLVEKDKDDWFAV